MSELEVDWLAMVYMIAGFTTRFVGMWVLDYFGLGPGVRDEIWKIWNAGNENWKWIQNRIGKNRKNEQKQK